MRSSRVPVTRASRQASSPTAVRSRPPSAARNPACAARSKRPSAAWPRRRSPPGTRRASSRSRSCSSAQPSGSATTASGWWPAVASASPRWSTRWPSRPLTAGHQVPRARLVTSLQRPTTTTGPAASGAAVSRRHRHLERPRQHLHAEVERPVREPGLALPRAPGVEHDHRGVVGREGGEQALEGIGLGEVGLPAEARHPGEGGVVGRLARGGDQAQRVVGALGDAPGGADAPQHVAGGLDADRGRDRDDRPRPRPTPRARARRRARRRRGRAPPGRHGAGRWPAGRAPRRGPGSRCSPSAAPARPAGRPPARAAGWRWAAATSAAASVGGWSALTRPPRRWRRRALPPGGRR